MKSSEEREKNDMRALTLPVCSWRARHILGQSKMILDKEFAHVDKPMTEAGVCAVQESTRVCTLSTGV